MVAWILQEGKNLVNQIQKRPTIKKIAKLVYIEINNFCLLKQVTKCVKRQAMECEEIFATHLSNRRLIHILGFLL